MNFENFISSYFPDLLHVNIVLVVIIFFINKKLKLLFLNRKLAMCEKVLLKIIKVV